MRPCRSDSGYVLFTALLALMTLSLLCSQIVFFSYIGTRMAAARRDGAAIEAAADGVVRQTIFNLLRTDTRRRVLERTYTVSVPGADATVRLQDLGGRVNPNLASPALFRALLMLVGADDTTADWIMAAQIAARASKPTGAFLVSATAVPPPGPFDDISELGGLRGMTPALLAALAPHLSVWGNVLPDPVLADPAVRRALDLSGEAAFAAAMRPDERIVRIEAMVKGPGGRSVTRRAVVRLGLGLDGLSWHLLAWDRVPP